MVAKLITIAVIVLGVVAVAQLMRVYELSSKLRKRGEHDITNRDNQMNARLMLGFMFFMFGGFIWLMLKYGWTGRGIAASVHGAELDWLLNLNFIIIIIVFFITNGLLFVFAYKYVKKPGVPAFYYPHNNKLEMLWTVVPACVLAVIIILGLRSWNSTLSSAKKEAVRVEIFSEQFAWTARYAGADNTLGEFDYKLYEGLNVLGIKTTQTIDSSIFKMEASIHKIESDLNDPTLVFSELDRSKLEIDLSRKERLIRLLHQMKVNHDPKKDKYAMDDVILADTLYLCKGQEYEFKFRSKDVIHSAYFPHFRAQMNTVPGMTTRFKFTPSLTTEEMRKDRNDEKFNYVLLCNKICGGSHYKMKMWVVVHEKDRYDRIMKAHTEGLESDNWTVPSKTFGNIYNLAEESADEVETNEGDEDENQELPIEEEGVAVPVEEEEAH